MATKQKTSVYAEDKQRAEDLSNEAWDKGVSGDYEGQIALLDEAIAIHPDKYSLCSRGNTKHKIGRFKEAIKDFDEAIRLNPEYDVAWSARGTAKVALGGFLRREEAIKDFDEAIRLNPDNVSVWYIRGVTKLASYQYKKAIKDFDELIRINPNDDVAWGSRGSAKLGLSRFADAIKDFEEALRLNPYNDGALKGIGSAEYQRNILKRGCRGTAVCIFVFFFVMVGAIILILVNQLGA